MMIELNQVELYLLKKEDTFLFLLYALHIKSNMQEDGTIEFTDEQLHDAYQDIFMMINKKRFVFMTPEEAMQRLIFLDLLQPVSENRYLLGCA